MEEPRKHILWVEDDDELASLFMARMKKHGLIVERAEDGEKALAMFDQLHPELLLVDLMVPKLSGFDVIKTIRSKPGIPQPKILILSALGRPDDAQEAIGLGADDYLIKSQVSLTEIIQTIRRHLDPPNTKTASAPVST